MKTDLPAKSEGMAQVHNVRFYTIRPRAIVCMAYSNVLKYLAVGRDDGSIELWDMHYAPYVDRVIHLTRETQVENLAWASKRLFSVDLTGKLIEWDLKKLKPRNQQSPTGNALWCLAVNKAETELAVGSEEGHINLMSIEGDEINYKRLFRKQEGRVLCCKFDKSGKRLVTGSVGAVRIWNVENGQILHTMSLSNKNVIVYAVQVLNNDTIIAGDSEGCVTVWNAANGTQVESTKVLDRNVFTLAINEEEDRLICSGMRPPLIRVLSKTRIKREDAVYERWIRFLQRDVHSHYVKALVVIDDRILSGGQDGMLCISSSSKTRPYVTRYAPYLQGKSACLSPTDNLLLLRYPQRLHLWRLGTPRPAFEPTKPLVPGSCEQLQLAQTPEKLLQIVAGSDKFIQAAAISPDSKWICYSTCSELRLNRLQLEPLAVQRVTTDLPPELGPANFMAFSKNKEEGEKEQQLLLFLLHATKRKLNCFSLDEQQVNFLYSIDMRDQLKTPVNLMELSPCGTYLIVSSCDHLIAVWKLRGKKCKHLLNLPRYRAAATAMAVHENSPRLVIAYTDGRLGEYDLVERQFVCESIEQFVPSMQTYYVRGLLLDPKNPNIVIVYDEMHLYVLESVQPEEVLLPHTKAKRQNLFNELLEFNKIRSYKLKMRLNRQHLLQVCRIDDEQLVTVGVQTKNYLAMLPAPYQRKKYGEKQ